MAKFSLRASLKCFSLTKAAIKFPRFPNLKLISSFSTTLCDKKSHNYYALSLFHLIRKLWHYCIIVLNEKVAIINLIQNGKKFENELWSGESTTSIFLINNLTHTINKQNYPMAYSLTTQTPELWSRRVFYTSVSATEWQQFLRT